MALRKWKFTVQTVSKLIKEVESRPRLWDIDHENYNDIHKMTGAWHEISKILNVPVNTIENKWKSLWHFFITIMRIGKVRNLEEYVGRWRYFLSMWFIYKPAMRSGADSEEEISNKNSDVTMKREPVEVEQTELFLEEYDPTPSKKRRKSSEDDFDEMFLKSLTPLFKKLDPVRKPVLRNKIQEILLNEISLQTTSTNKFY